MTSHKIFKTLAVVGLLASASLIPFTTLGQVPTTSAVAAQSSLTTQRIAAIDHDNDGLPDAVEKKAGLNPNNRDSNGNGIWDSDETVPGLGITYDQAYVRGYYSDADGSADDMSGGDDDGGGTGTVNKPKPLPKLTCTRPHQRNCKPITCKAKKGQSKAKRAKACKPGKVVSPTPRPSTNPTLTPTPRPTTGGTTSPTAKPTPVPTTTGNFDANGNTTKFGIPSGMSGNITAGSSVQASNCNGCHTEKQGRSFGQLKASLSIGPMSFIKLSDSQIANLTAYLNRFNK
jgi:hypothetical protein